MTSVMTDLPVREPSDPHIEVTEDEVRLLDFRIANRDVAAYLLDSKEEDRAKAFVNAIEVGVHCIQRANSSTDIEFIKRCTSEIINDIATKMDLLGGKLEQELVEKLGSEDGQVLKPVIDLINLVSKNCRDQLIETKNEIDPCNDASALGKAIKGIKDLIDPNRKDSVQGSLEAAVTNVTGEDGAIAKAVKAVVNEVMEPVNKRLEKLSDQILGKEAAEDAVMQTIEKGKPFEKEVVDALRPWANMVGAEMTHVGVDNRAGDILVKLTATSVAATDLCVVIEARDDQEHRAMKRLSNDLAKKMITRDANAAIYLSRSTEGLGKEIGDWAEGATERGPWVATTYEHLRTALRLLIVLHKLRSIRTMTPEVDVSVVETQIRRIRTTLERIKDINTKVTAVHKSADGISDVAGTLRNEIRQALLELEDAIGIVGGKDEEKHSSVGE